MMVSPEDRLTVMAILGDCLPNLYQKMIERMLL